MATIAIITQHIQTSPPSRGIHARQRPIFLSFGLIRPYKNIPASNTRLEQLPVPRPQLIVAGRPLTTELETAIRHEAEGANDVRLILRFINDDEVPTIFSAADAALMPYAEPEPLNSGVAHLALSLGKPAIVNDTAANRDLQDIFGPDWVWLCDGTPEDALRVAVDAAIADRPEVPDSLTSSMRRYWEPEEKLAGVLRMPWLHDAQDDVTADRLLASAHLHGPGAVELAPESPGPDDRQGRRAKSFSSVGGQQFSCDALAGVAIPQGWPPRAGAELAPGCRRDDPGGVAPDQLVRALREGNGTFGVGPQGKARHAEDGSFLLYAARVGEHQARRRLQGDEVEVPGGRDQPDPLG